MANAQHMVSIGKEGWLARYCAGTARSAVTPRSIAPQNCGLRDGGKLGPSTGHEL